MYSYSGMKRPTLCSVPPGEPIILEEEGDPVKENTVGPYREGATIALDCIVYGGNTKNVPITCHIRNGGPTITATN